MSGLGQQDAELALEANDNLYPDDGRLSRGLPRGDRRALGAERVLFASGFPRFDPRFEILRVRWAPASTRPAKAAILGGNAGQAVRARAVARRPSWPK